MYQLITLVGNLGADPDLRYTPSGQQVTNLSVATNRRYNDSSGQLRTETVWFRVAVWGNQAEACAQYLKKGRQVLVEGRLNADANGNPRIWTRQDGTPAASYEINARTVRFLGKPDSPPPQDDTISEPVEMEPETSVSEIPF